MSPTKPYLLRAFYEWILDNQKTPYIVVNASQQGVHVPTEYIEDGKIILNVSPRAVQKLRLGNDRVEFVAKFSGVSVPIFIPPSAVIAIYAKENGRGMVFPENETEQKDDGGDIPPEPTKPTTTPDKKKNRDHLRVVK